jgi:hypothetical protein
MAMRSKAVMPQNLERDLYTSSFLSVREQQEVFASAARTIIEDAKAQNARVLGRVPNHTIAVDGREGAPLNSIQIPNGVVVVEFELVFEAISWIGDMLRQFSPVKKGVYRDSHVLLADNVAVDPDAIPPIADEYQFVNLTPYARKIERRLSPKAPTGVYQSVAKLAASSSKFGNVARIKFGYITPLFGAIDKWAGSSAGAAWAQKKSRRRKELHGEWLRRQPAIIVTMPGK